MYEQEIKFVACSSEAFVPYASINLKSVDRSQVPNPSEVPKCGTPSPLTPPGAPVPLKSSRQRLVIDFMEPAFKEQMKSTVSNSSDSSAN